MAFQDAFPRSARAAETASKSSTKPASASWRSSRSRIRKIAEGWTVTAPIGASGVSSRRSRSRVTRTEDPNSAFPAVAQRATTARRADRLQLGLQPGTAGLDLARPRRLVEAALAAWPPFEVLDRIGQVDGLARDRGFLQGAIEQASGRPHKGLALAVLLVPRLLSHQHQLSACPPFAEDRLRRVLPQIASTAALRGPAQARQTASWRQEVCGGGAHRLSFARPSREPGPAPRCGSTRSPGTRAGPAPRRPRRPCHGNRFCERERCDSDGAGSPVSRSNSQPPFAPLLTLSSKRLCSDPYPPRRCGKRGAAD